MVILLCREKTIAITAIFYFPFFSDLFYRVGKIPGGDIGFGIFEMFFHFGFVVGKDHFNFENPSGKIYQT
jgi:hypothetical protein